MSSFWDRRRAAVAQEERDAQAKVEADALAEEHAALEEKSDEEILAELDLPDPETLAPGDDIRPFMREIVPDRIRRQALRRLWRLNPVLANLDGMVDYGEDFTDAGTVVENLQTAYQVGKGMLAHVLQVEEDRARAEGELEEVALAPASDDSPAEAEPEQNTQEIGSQNQHVSPANETKVQQDAAATETVDLTQEEPRPRRMRFSFETEST